MKVKTFLKLIASLFVVSVYIAASSFVSGRLSEKLTLWVMGE